MTKSEQRWWARVQRDFTNRIHRGVFERIEIYFANIDGSREQPPPCTMRSRRSRVRNPTGCSQDADERRCGWICIRTPSANEDRIR